MARLVVFAAALALLCLPRPAAALPDFYELDRPHTQIMFSVSHLGFSHSWGRFLDYSGHFTLDETKPGDSAAEAVIHTASVDMGDDAWTRKVRAMFHVGKYPDMTFKSTGVKKISGRKADVTGRLTLLGVMKPVTLHVVFNKEGRNPFGKYVAGFSASADIVRSDFGMTDYLPAVGDDVHIVIEAEGNRKDRPGQEQYNQ